MTGLMTDTGKPAAGQEQSPAADGQPFTLDMVDFLPAVAGIYLSASAISRKQIKIRKIGDLTVLGSVREKLDITTTTVSVFIDLIKDISTGYPLVRLSLVNTGTTTCMEVPLVKNRFIIPTGWRDVTLLFPGTATEFAVHQAGDGSHHALVVPVVSHACRVALVYPDPAILKAKHRDRDTSIKSGKNWLSPPLPWNPWNGKRKNSLPSV